MSILVHIERPIGAATLSGTWNGNTVAINGLLQQILVKPTTSNTEYDFYLTDDKNRIIYNQSDITGTLNDEVNIPFNGVYTMTLENATRDEAFEVSLSVRER